MLYRLVLFASMHTYIARSLVQFTQYTYYAKINKTFLTPSINIFKPLWLGGVCIHFYPPPPLHLHLYMDLITNTVVGESRFSCHVVTQYDLHILDWQSLVHGTIANFAGVTSNIITMKYVYDRKIVSFSKI